MTQRATWGTPIVSSLSFIDKDSSWRENPRLKRWVHRYALIVIGCLMAPVLAGCGGSNGSTPQGASLTRRVLALKPTSSIEDVRSRIGAPLSEASKGEEVTLNYGTWQLIFVEGRLTKRARVVVPRGAHRTANSSALNRKIMALSLGESVNQIEVMLGTPEVIYVIYEGTSAPIRVLRYSSWELTVVNGKLEQRAR